MAPWWCRLGDFVGDRDGRLVGDLLGLLLEGELLGLLLDGELDGLLIVGELLGLLIVGDLLGDLLGRCVGAAVGR